MREEKDTMVDPVKELADEIRAKKDELNRLLERAVEYKVRPIVEVGNSRDGRCQSVKIALQYYI